MKRIMFVCHGNICRSPMAEYVFKDMINKSGIADDFFVCSSATSTEEIYHGIGNPVYPPVLKLLMQKGIDARLKRAVQLKSDDYQKYDLFVCMDTSNYHNIMRIFGNDKENNVHKLMSYAGSNADVSDPWYTRDFDTCYNDIYQGCEALLNKLTK